MVDLASHSIFEKQLRDSYGSLFSFLNRSLYNLFYEEITKGGY